MSHVFLKSAQTQDSDLISCPDPEGSSRSKRIQGPGYWPWLGCVCGGGGGVTGMRGSLSAWEGAVLWNSASTSLEQPRANLAVLGTGNATALPISRNIRGQTRALCGTHWEQPGAGLSAWFPSPPLFSLLPPFLHLPLPSILPVPTCAGLAPFHLLPSPCSVPASQRSEDGATPAAVCRKVKQDEC